MTGSPVIAVVRAWADSHGNSGEHLYFWCPGCDHLHGVEIKDPKTRWGWNRDLARPTITPSILVNGDPARVHPTAPRCHSFVTDGEWRFLADCSHPLAGQTVAMVPLPDWMRP